ncbi:hypothetical protein MARPO_0001s0429 [Marchantia polymorpha]|uniref:Uncharacterized protein n=1 Tax=Marchantia polymorpha TaxID=3197 RepID=A0A2R6XWJ0_MARPO|nr:hypothetical protein MARPO_0001s0429 [Marchantia polymorpha]|eukprot:PTQ50465.1 hypothetical protein MARPO_0001s0429 [Marchantia polymorpha]
MPVQAAWPATGRTDDRMDGTDAERERTQQRSAEGESQGPVLGYPCSVIPEGKRKRKRTGATTHWAAAALRHARPVFPACPRGERQSRSCPCSSTAELTLRSPSGVRTPTTGEVGGERRESRPPPPLPPAGLGAVSRKGAQCTALGFAGGERERERVRE